MCMENQLKNWLTKPLYKDVYHNCLIIFIIFFSAITLSIIDYTTCEILLIINVKSHTKLWQLLSNTYINTKHCTHNVLPFET